MGVKSLMSTPSPPMPSLLRATLPLLLYEVYNMDNTPNYIFTGTSFAQWNEDISADLETLFLTQKSNSRLPLTSAAHPQNRLMRLPRVLPTGPR
eukprot:gene18241-24691_t